MRRLVIDTNIYIDWFNAEAHEDILFQRGVVRHLSAVVLMELRAGASRRDLRLVEALESAAVKTNRLLLPTAAVFSAAGEALRRLQTRRGFQIETHRSIVNDVLIALSARSIGATVVTQNSRHYQAIRAVAPFQLQIIGP